MDLLSLGFLLLILVASGVIAWVADGLGKKIGKKRLSLFGLRPKHVASLGTVAMGVCVSMLTIGLVAASSQEAREWLQKGRGLIVDLQQTERDLRETEARNATLQADIRRQENYEQELQKGNQKLKGTNERLDAANGRLQASLDRERDALTKERTALGNLRNDSRKLLVERDRLRLQAGTYKIQVADAKVQFDATRGRLAVARKSLAKAKASLSISKRNLVAANESIAATNENADKIAKTSFTTYQQNVALQTEVATRQDLVDRLQKETDGLVRQRDAAEDQVADALVRYQGLLAQLDEASQRMAIAQDLVNRFGGIAKTSRTEALTYRRGEEVARVVVPGGSDEDVTATLLNGLLRTARSEAVARGAKGHRANGENFDAADIVGRQDPKTGAVASPALLRRALVAGVAGREEDQVLVATSSLNAFTGEPVSLDISVMPNPVVYRRNDTLAETRLDGAQPEDRILAEFSAFFKGRVREKALHDRMIPRAFCPDPFGGFSDADAWSLVQSVKRTGRSVRVAAVAEADIRAADPLRLEFRVR